MRPFHLPCSTSRFSCLFSHKHLGSLGLVFLEDFGCKQGPKAPEPHRGFSVQLAHEGTQRLIHFITSATLAEQSLAGSHVCRASGRSSCSGALQAEVRAAARCPQRNASPEKAGELTTFDSALTARCCSRCRGPPEEEGSNFNPEPKTPPQCFCRAISSILPPPPRVQAPRRDPPHHASTASHLCVGGRWHELEFRSVHENGAVKAVGIIQERSGGALQAVVFRNDVQVARGCCKGWRNR